MQEKQFKAFKKKNIEKFDVILNNFFERKELTIYTYYPKEYILLENLIIENFEELKTICMADNFSKEMFYYIKNKEEMTNFEIENCTEFLQ